MNIYSISIDNTILSFNVVCDVFNFLFNINDCSVAFTYLTFQGFNIFRIRINFAVQVTNSRCICIDTSGVSVYLSRNICNICCVTCYLFRYTSNSICIISYISTYCFNICCIHINFTINISYIILNSCNRFTIIFNSFCISINFYIYIIDLAIDIFIIFNNLSIDIFINFVNNSCVVVINCSVNILIDHCIVIRNCGVDIISNHCVICFNLRIDFIFYICDCCTNFTIQFLDSIFISRDTFRMMNNVAINVIKTLIMTVYAFFKARYITFNAINLNIYITNLRIDCVVNLFVVFIDFYINIFINLVKNCSVIFSNLVIDRLINNYIIFINFVSNSVFDICNLSTNMAF